MNELTSKDPQYPIPFIVDSSEVVYFLNVPCSWGMIVGGKEWGEFLDYYRRRETEERVIGILSYKWSHSWKK